MSTDSSTHRALESVGRNLRGVHSVCDGRVVHSHACGTFDAGPDGFIWHGEENPVAFGKRPVERRNRGLQK